MISYELMNPVDGQTTSVQRQGLWVCLVFVWLLMLGMFSEPGRSGNTLDVIGLIKVTIRMLGLLVLGITIVRSWHHPRRRIVARCLFPLGLYVVWSIFSTLWSPLTMVSMGQVGGLLLQVMLTFMIALQCDQWPERSKIIFHLSMAMLVISTAILVIHAVSPEASGLMRELGEGMTESVSIGFVHPTAAGATASLGMVILFTARLLWGWQWSRVALVPGLLIHGVVLLVSMSRTAVAVGAGTMLLSFLMFSRRLIASGVIAAVCFFFAGYVVIDPGLELVDGVFKSALEYVRRGETEETLRSITGRTALWEGIWDEYMKSPLIGHGYFVTSEHGELDVWLRSGSNLSAHNVMLQVLASTGVIGALLFLWGLILPLVTCGKSLLIDSQGRTMAAFLSVIGIWYIGWGLFCESFMGPVGPESVVFFTLLGIAIGIHSSNRQTI